MFVSHPAKDASTDLIAPEMVGFDVEQMEDELGYVLKLDFKISIIHTPETSAIIVTSLRVALYGMDIEPLSPVVIALPAPSMVIPIAVSPPPPVPQLAELV